MQGDLKKYRWLPTFPQAMEEDFRLSYNEASLSHLRYGSVIGVLVYLFFAYLAPPQFDLESRYADQIRNFLVYPGFVSLFAVTYWRAASRRLQLFLAVFCLVVLGGSEIGFVLTSPRHVQALLQPALVIITLSIYCAFRLRFWPALATSLLAGAIVGWAAVSSGYLEPGQLRKLLTILIPVNGIGAFVALRFEHDSRKAFLQRQQIELEMNRAESLLLNVLPAPIAAKLKLDEATIADSYAEATVLFADIVGFTALSASRSPQEIVEILNEMVSCFDQLAEVYQIEKIKTIGDAYMAVCGLPQPNARHARQLAQMALAMLGEIERFNARHGMSLALRIGLNTGPVIAGVIGRKRFIYDLWGDTVNIASRMESHGRPGSIQVTEATYQHLAREFAFVARGPIEVRGKGEMHTYWLIAQKDQAARDVG